MGEQERAGSFRNRRRSPPGNLLHATGLWCALWAHLLGALAASNIAVAGEQEVPPSDLPAAPAGGGGEPSGSSKGLHLGPLELSGVLRQSHRFRSSGEESDQDLYGYLGLDGVYRGEGRDGEGPFGKMKFNLQASYNLDIDSFQSGGGAPGFFPFLDLSNTFNGRFHGFLHSAYVEVQDMSLLDHIRIGRQQIHREEPILFDGGFARTKTWKTLSLDVYGGLPAHLYETSASGDLLAGAGLEARPASGLMLGADYIFLRDARKALPDSEDQLFILRGSFQINREWTINASGSWIDGRDRRQILDLQYASRDWGLLAYLRVLRQNGIVDIHADELSSYVLVQGAYAPFYEFRFDASQPLGEKFAAGGGVHFRQLQDSSDAGLFNHSFRNYYLSLEARDLWRGGRISINGDLWDADGEDIYAVSIELEQQVKDLVRIRLGNSYSQYRFDRFTGTERNRDRLYYARFRWRLTPSLDLDTDYQYEKDSDAEYHRLTVNLRKTF